MARRTKEDAAETRQQILENALDLFSKKGYSRSTFVDIARQIGLSKGAVYWHFKSKTDLLVALIDYAMSQRGLQVDNPNDLPASLESLRDCYVGSAGMVLKDPLLRKFEFFINFQIEWSGELLGEVRKRLAEMGRDPFWKYSIAIRRLQELEVIDSSRDAEKLGTVLIAMWMGLMRMIMIGLISEDDLIHQLREQFDQLFKEIVNKET